MTRRLLKALGISLLGAGFLMGQGKQPEYRMKARFLPFVGQAATRAGGGPLVPSGTTFQVGVLGLSPFEGHLAEALEGRTIGGAPVRLTHPRTPPEVRACHLVFVCPSEMDRLGEVLGWLEGRPVVTVGDRPEFLDRGGMVAFLITAGRVEIWVNPASAKAAGLAFDPSFLALARVRKSSE